MRGVLSFSEPQRNLQKRQDVSNTTFSTVNFGCIGNDDDDDDDDDDVDDGDDDEDGGDDDDDGNDDDNNDN